MNDVNNVDVLAFGRARNYDTAIALYKVGKLNRLFAGGYLLSSWQKRLRAFSFLCKNQKFQRLLFRSTTEIPDKFCVPVWSHIFLSLGKTEPENFFFQHQVFSQRCGELSKSPIIIAEQTEALEAFRIAKMKNRKTILMLTGASPFVRLQNYAEEYIKRGKDDIFLEGLIDSRLVGREVKEILLSDCLISPSSFVTQTINETPLFKRKRIFEVNWPIFSTDFITSRKKKIVKNRPFHILFVGRICLEKGIYYLVEALKTLSDVPYEAVFVGGIDIENKYVKEIERLGKIIGFVNYSEMRKYYEWADVLILPSLSEGRARVTIEAMGAGLPVIVTPNSGAPINNRENGILVPLSSSTEIAYAIKELFNDRLLYEHISKNCLLKIQQMNMESYGKDLVAALNAIDN